MSEHNQDSFIFSSAVFLQIKARVTDPSFRSDGKLRVYTIAEPPAPFNNQEISMLHLAPSKTIRALDFELLNAFAGRLLGSILYNKEYIYSERVGGKLRFPYFMYQEDFSQRQILTHVFVYPSTFYADAAYQARKDIMYFIDMEMSGKDTDETKAEFEKFVTDGGEERKDLMLGFIAMNH